MKKHYIILATIMSVLLASCSSTYKFCQIYETKPVEQDYHLKSGNGSLQYENTQCIVEYCFWSNGGTADFNFYNKTDDIIYIDLAKSFFVMNGVAYDLYQGREWSHSTSVGYSSSTTYGYSASRAAAVSVGLIEPNPVTDGVVGAKVTGAASRSESISSGNVVAHSTSNRVTIKEKQIIAVPPHSKKYIEAYSIASSPLLSCELPRYPSTSARIDFTSDNSPYRFSDIITYAVGDSAHAVTVTNEFYVSSVTNYAEPEIVVMKMREDPCENMRDPDYEEPTSDLYDKMVRDNICETTSSFYNTYKTTTTKKLYDNDWLNGYTYDPEYHAYVKSGPKGKRNFVGLIAAIGMVGVGIILGSGALNQ